MWNVWWVLKLLFDILTQSIVSGKSGDGVCVADGVCCTADECKEDKKCNDVEHCPLPVCEIDGGTGFCASSTLCCSESEFLLSWNDIDFKSKRKTKNFKITKMTFEFHWIRYYTLCLGSNFGGAFWSVKTLNGIDTKTKSHQTHVKTLKACLTKRNLQSIRLIPNWLQGLRV